MNIFGKTPPSWLATEEEMKLLKNRFKHGNRVKLPEWWDAFTEYEKSVFDNDDWEELILDEEPIKIKEINLRMGKFIQIGNTTPVCVNINIENKNINDIFSKS